MPSFFLLFGQPRSFIPDELTDYVFHTQIPEAFQNGLWQGEFTLLDKNKGSFPVSMVVVSQKTEDGRPLSASIIARDITEIKAAEAKIRDSETHLRTILQQSPLPIVITNIENKIEFLNESFFNVFGYSSDEIPSVDEWWPLAYPDDAYRRRIKAVWEDEMALAFSQKRPTIPVEAKICCKDKTEKYCTVIGSFIGGKTFIIFNDLTQRIIAQEERDKFFNLTLDLLCIAGTDGYFKKINPSWEKTFGYSEKEFLSRPFFDFIHPDDVQPTIAAVRELSEQKPVINFINRYRCKDGSYRWLSWVSTPYRDTIYAAAHDITVLKCAQIDLAESEKRWKELIDSLPQLVWTCRVDGPCDFLSTQWVNYTGIPEEEQLGYGWLQQLHPEDKERVIDEWAHKVKTGENFDIEFRIRRYDGTYRWFKTKAIPLRDLDSNIVKWFGSNTDFDDVKKAEEKLLLALKNLERSNKELEQFAYVASHDLQEPLRMVSSYTQLLERRYKDKLDQDASDFINFAVDGANRMQRLINDLLEYSRISTRGKEMVKIDLSSVLGMAIANVHNRIQETKALVTNDDLPFAYGDETQLVRLFQNLIDNALKYKGVEPPRIHIGFRSDPNQITISVKDNGIGINEQFQEKVFTIFQRLHNKTDYPGTGIGLSICKRIVERHGGKIWFESDGINGTAFYFTLNTKGI